MLSLRNLFNLGLGYALHTQTFEAVGIELINNNADEIRELALEVDDRIKGVWMSTVEDEILQQKFWEIFKRYASINSHLEIKARVGAVFLRKNRDLLT